MPRLNFKNNCFTILAEDIISDTQDAFEVADASVLPAVPFRLTILDGDSKGSAPVEIVEVGAKNEETNVLSSVLRGQEGTTATTHSSGVRLENRLTAEAYGKIFAVDDVIIGTGAAGTEENTVVIGRDAKAGNIGSGAGLAHIAIGHEASTQVEDTGPLHGGIAIGRLAKSKSSYNIVIGAWAEGGGSGHSNVVSVGLEAKANYGGSVAVGAQAKAGKTYEAGYSVAVGPEAVTEAVQCVALGYMAEAGVNQFDGSYATALGPHAKAWGDQSVCIGYSAQAGKEGDGWAGAYCVAIGSSALAWHQEDETDHRGMIALGYYALATRERAIAIGYQADATQTEAIAIGDRALSESRGVAIGYTAKARGAAAIAIGEGVLTGNIGAGTGNSHIAIGHEASTRVDSESNFFNCIAIGRSAEAQYSNAVAIGRSAIAGGTRGIAIGFQAGAGEESVAIGYGAGGGSREAGHNYFIAIGAWSEAGEGTISIGGGTAITATGAIAIKGNAGNIGAGAGTDQISIGNFATTRVDSASDVNRSIAIGYFTKAQHNNAVAIGALAETGAENDFMLGAAAHNVKVPGSFEVLGSGDGVIVTTPDGTKRYKITVDDAGALVTTLQ